MVEEAHRLSSRSPSDFKSVFTDNAFSGGNLDDGFEIFHHEFQLAHKYGLHVDPSKFILYLLAADQFRGDVSRFQALGIKVVTGGDVMMLKAPIGDNPAFLRDFLYQKFQEFDSLCTMLETLPHVAYYLFRCGGIVSKLQCYYRTTPRDHLSILLQDFHDRQKRTLETFLGSPLNNHQWTQAKLHTKLGGAGLVSIRTEIGLDVVSLADVGFLVSHRRCGPSIQQLFSPQPAPNLHDCEGPAVRHLTACLPELGSILQDPHVQIDYKTILQRLHHQMYSGLVQQQDRVG